MKIRHSYKYDQEAASRESAFVCVGESRTKQSFKDECDINVIVKRFGVTGMLPQNVRAPMYGDFTMVGDFRSAMEVIRSTQASFDAMSAEVRARFNNDPQSFLEFCSRKENLDEMRRMGLAKPLPVPDPVPPKAA